jgi:hypothetical protein
VEVRAKAEHIITSEITQVALRRFLDVALSGRRHNIGRWRRGRFVGSRGPVRALAGMAEELEADSSGPPRGRAWLAHPTRHAAAALIPGR